MPKNALSLRARNLGRLRVGEAVLLGPFAAANAAANKVTKFRQSASRYRDWEFVQEQWLLVNPRTLAAFKMYRVTRVR